MAEETPAPPSQSASKSTEVSEKALDRAESPSSQPASVENVKHVGMEGALLDLMMGAFLPCVPVVITTSLLLTMILGNRVDIDPGWSILQTPTAPNASDLYAQNTTFRKNLMGGHNAYYVRFNPAALAAIASWSSKIIPFLTGTSMAVIAFFAGRRMLNATKAGRQEELPSPHQMSILIRMLNGYGAKPLWDVFLYRWHNHAPLVQPIRLAFSALLTLLIVTFAISGADTWFAVTTKPVNVELLSRHTLVGSTFGRDLDPAVCNASLWEQRACPSNSQLQCYYPCSIEDYSPTGGMNLREGIKGAEQSAETLLGNSYTNVIQNISDPRDPNNDQYYYLADVNTGSVLDFMANSTAVQTQCEVVTQNCNISSSDETFTCGPYSTSLTFPGQVGIDPTMAMAPENMSMVGIQFFNDTGFAQPVGFGNQSVDLFPTQNPMHFLVWSKGFPPIDTSSQTFAGMRQGNYLKIDHAGDNIFIVNCTATIYNVTYAWVNSSVLASTQSADHSFWPSLAPQSYAGIYSAPFAINSALGHVALQNAAALAAYLTTPQDLARKFANEFSRSAVALTAGIMTPIPNMIEQSRNNTELLTRVPYVPLYFLISLKALYALLSITIALLAVFLTNPIEAQEVKARLTVDGLTQGLFEPRANQERGVETVDDLYGEHRGAMGMKTERKRLRKKEGPDAQPKEREVTKVGMQQVPQGGWMWVTTGSGSGNASGSDNKAWNRLGMGQFTERVGHSVA